MNRFWQNTFNQTPRGFHDFPRGGLQVDNPWRPRTLRVGFAHGSHPQPTDIERILHVIVGISFIARHPRALWQIEAILPVSARFTQAAWSEKEFHRLSGFSDHDMQLEPIKIAPLTGLIAAPNLSLLAFGAQAAVIIASCHRVAVQDLHRLRVLVFPILTQGAELGPDQRVQVMQATVACPGGLAREAALTEQTGNVALIGQGVARSFKVPGKKQGGHKHGGHDLRIAHLTLGIFVMVKSFQHVVTQTINRYNLGVQGFTCKWFGFVTHQFTRNLWIFLPPTQGCNLG